MAGTYYAQAGAEGNRESDGRVIVISVIVFTGVRMTIRTRESVVWTVARKLPITIELAFLSLLVALAIINLADDGLRDLLDPKDY
jgi:hypothetical protein